MERRLSAAAASGDRRRLHPLSTVTSADLFMELSASSRTGCRSVTVSSSIMAGHRTLGRVSAGCPPGGRRSLHGCRSWTIRRRHRATLADRTHITFGVLRRLGSPTNWIEVSRFHRPEPTSTLGIDRRVSKHGGAPELEPTAGWRCSIMATDIAEALEPASMSALVGERITAGRPRRLVVDTIAWGRRQSTGAALDAYHSKAGQLDGAWTLFGRGKHPHRRLTPAWRIPSAR